MNSTDYDRAGRVLFGVVDLVGKRKACGKENCGQCPHGPFWYATIPAADSSTHRRIEVYLGRAWGDGDLRAKVAPKLCVEARRVFLGAVDAVVKKERIAHLERDLIAVRKSKVEVAERAQREQAKLQRDQAAIEQELSALKGRG
jgi:hypothetical protein